MAQINIEVEALEECLRNGEIAEPLYQQVNKWLNEQAKSKKKRGKKFQRAQRACVDYVIMRAALQKK